jgi:alpha-L-fucosidase
MTTRSRTGNRILVAVITFCCILIPGCIISQGNSITIPYHLQGHDELFRQNPSKAALKWFQDAKFGMMICYYLASLDGRHCFEQLEYRIPVKEYEKKMRRFRAEKFDADFICDRAAKAEMKYITFVVKHCEGFCLWQTAETSFNSFNSLAHRDLVEEMADACKKHGLGLFIFYEHGFDWRHPHGPRKRDFSSHLTEVPYPTPEPTYAYGKDYDLSKYVDYVYAQITELLTMYGPVAGVWLDGAGVPASGDHRKFRLQELYNHIHRLQPHALISYKWGITGTEDFFAPERGQIKKVKADQRTSKPTELCEPLNKGWSYIKNARRENADWVISRLEYARKNKMNYLLGIGLLPDGSVHPKDIRTLGEVGQRIRKTDLLNTNK